jgi:hypothetical protein
LRKVEILPERIQGWVAEDVLFNCADESGEQARKQKSILVLQKLYQ